MRKLLIIVSLFTMMSCQENFDMIDSESLPETSSTNPEFKVNELLMSFMESLLSLLQG